MPISPRIHKLEVPHNPVPLNSAFYIERYSLESLRYIIESFCYDAIAQPAALIRIKALRQMGKTSLREGGAYAPTII
ncbi:AAA-like domain-containing protein [Nostoc sp. CHAB 5844]|nr:AAA-like domain-containing protein [Nostoc sp. CHAB 5844]